VIGVVVLAGLFIVTGVLMAQADKWFSNPRRGCGGLV
jgi:hypothetical protein